MKTVWLLVDHQKIGSYNQCLGLAKGLEIPLENSHIKWFSPKWPWSFLPNSCWPFPFSAQALKDYPLIPPYPDLVIASGRKSAAPAAFLKKKGIPTVFILNPYMPPSAFDWVICPTHDHLQGPNIIKTLGSLHPIDDASIFQAKKKFQDFCSPLPSPRVAVFIGGDTTYQKLGIEAYDKLAVDLLDAYDKGMFQSVMITASRRTQEASFQRLLERISMIPHVSWSPHRPSHLTNPYFGFLAFADLFIVTNDSINMISESCYLQKPVLIYPFAKIKKKFKEFTQSLYEQGYAFPFQISLPEVKVFEKLDERTRVVDFLKAQRFT